MLSLLAATTALALPTHDEPLRLSASAPEDAAVVIGIEDYFALPDVPYAERDATAVQDLLIYTLGVPSGRVHRITSGASREKMRRALSDAADQVGDDGTLWIYFAGHGAAHPATGERVLLGVDTVAEAESFQERSVSVSSMKELVSSAPRTVLMVDACYAGAGRHGGDLLPGKRFAVPSYATASDPQWIEWNAAQPNELSGPLEPARHGAFTWAMVGALRGWADGQLDGQRDGTITLEEADLYVQEVLRAVDIRDQVPALQAADRTASLMSVSAEDLEDRPDHASLKIAVQPATVPGPSPRRVNSATEPAHLPQTPPSSRSTDSATSPPMTDPVLPSELGGCRPAILGELASVFYCQTQKSWSGLLMGRKPFMETSVFWTPSAACDLEAELPPQVQNPAPLALDHRTEVAAMWYEVPGQGDLNTGIVTTCRAPYTVTVRDVLDRRGKREAMVDISQRVWRALDAVMP